ncbi:MAG: copper amine oxidase N-terminal domain-containing protein [Clostridia bacterium]|nr:copper amine oxidase N-terminal domain-containing protein [Clostridia bacterium]
MKKFLCILSAFLMLFPNFVYADNITVRLDNSNIEFTSVSPAIIEGRTMIPIRGIFENLGYEIIWYGETKTAVFKNSTSNIVFPLNESYFTLNGETKQLDVPACIINGSAMIPLRALGEATGLDVYWDNETKTVDLYSCTPIPEMDAIAENIHYYCFSKSAVDNYIDILKSGEYKSPYATYSVDTELYNYIILANLAKNLSDYINTYLPAAPYSQDYIDSVNSILYEANQYYIAVASDSETADPQKLNTAVNNYTALKESLNTLIDSELNNYILSLNADTQELSSYKSNINSILNVSVSPSLDYNNEERFFNSIEEYILSLRNEINSVRVAENVKPYKYALICVINSVNKSIENINSIKINGSIQNFYDKYNMINAEQEFYSKIIEAFFENTSAHLFKS